MKRLPLRCPESRAIGARPARLATHLFSMVPSSGMSEFWHVDEHGQCARLADAWTADEDCQAGLQGGIGKAQLAQGSIDGGDLALDLAQPLRSQALEQGRTQGVAAVRRGDAVLDQGASCDEQLLHGIEGLADHGPGWQLVQRAEAGEHGSIDGIGLGTPADGLGEASGLQRVDFDHGQAGLAELALEDAMIGAGWLEDDAADRALFEPRQQGCDAGGVVGELSRDGLGVEIDVECVFGDVDADRMRYGGGHLFPVLCLSSGPWRPGIRSGHKEKRGAVTL